MDVFTNILQNDEKIIKWYKPNCKRFILVHILILLPLSLFIGACVIAALYYNLILLLKMIDPSKFGLFIMHNWFVIPIIIVIWIVAVFIYVYLTYRNTCYAISNKRIINRTWCFRTRYKCFPISSVKTVISDITWLDSHSDSNITGNIIFNYRADSGYKANSHNNKLKKNGYIFEHVNNVDTTLEEIKELIDKYQNRRLD